MTAQDIVKKIESQASPDRAKINSWFFKTAPGQYGEGDLFLGLTVPQIRKILKDYKDLPHSEILKLLKNKYHEVRLFALLVMVQKFPASPDEIFNLYIQNTQFINSWDLVDLTAPYIVGPYLENKSKAILIQLSHSKNIWERRIAILSTFYYIKFQKPDQTLKIAEILIYDKHDLIQKAVGWMLREIGKHCSLEVEEEFLDRYAATMPRTTLRYAIEKFPPQQRLYYMGLKIKLRT